MKTIHVKGVDSATVEDKEKYLSKPTFKPLWQDQVHIMLQHLRLIIIIIIIIVIIVIIITTITITTTLSSS